MLQRSEIERYLTKNTNILFNELVVEAFLEISKKESFWFDLDEHYIEERLQELRPEARIIAGEQELRLLVLPFAYIIDAKSPFTSTHSLGVAVLSRQLAEIAGLTEITTLIEIAGLVHDIGKLGVPNKILEKNGPLTDVEFELIKTHPYFTYHMLNKISGFEDLARWAGYHHEQPNGQGYPFKLSGDELCVPSRIIAVADKWVALTEKRPYREALDVKEALDILTDMAAKEIVDRKIVKLLKENIDYITGNKEKEAGYGMIGL
ncbi:HD-GYP domain-containing protein [Carboxydothermus ferrireducens]|uniref:HD-GYP domain-containing protein (C-di-GMP phosphodiesterase class II) n=1 Tax=Carboxydothermus ferrireducens DSM 11255 TaxID=1119529 RepID=A0ABX2R6A1_9THEO|nr:HD domain-containing phosphohydrolase [Carboxydothermus ferrireducens]NYE56704.1 HD-GYP domain-containing protein (c-di-GMP phosphodiesterase class II) [Carboxydothermus ferrireducens DSM 11255]